jgi:hypothetical protein
MMRILPAAAACAITISIAGCGQVSDNEMLANFRETQVNACVAAARASPSASRLDWPRQCGCTMDRYMAGKTASDLRNADPHDPALHAASQQCAMEQMRAALDDIANGQADNGTAPGN